MDETISHFVKNRRLALVGVSRQKGKFGNLIFKELTSRGYQITPVHPVLKTFEEVACAPSFKDLKGKVDGAVVCINPELVVDVLQEASDAGIKDIWLQQGAESEPARKKAEELNLNLVSRKCILMYAEPVQSFHKVHRFFAKVFGQL